MSSWFGNYSDRGSEKNIEAIYHTISYDSPNQYVDQKPFFRAHLDLSKPSELPPGGLAAGAQSSGAHRSGETLGDAN